MMRWYFFFAPLNLNFSVCRMYFVHTTLSLLSTTYTRFGSSIASIDIMNGIMMAHGMTMALHVAKRWMCPFAAAVKLQRMDFVPSIQDNFQNVVSIILLFINGRLCFVNSEACVISERHVVKQRRAKIYFLPWFFCFPFFWYFISVSASGSVDLIGEQCVLEPGFVTFAIHHSIHLACTFHWHRRWTAVVHLAQQEASPSCDEFVLFGGVCVCVSNVCVKSP